MKKALYYSVRVKTLYPYVVAVTSEKGSRRWYGRDCRTGESTNGLLQHTRGRFDTQADAESKVAAIKEIDDRLKVKRDELSKQQNAFAREERLEIDALFEQASGSV